MRWPDARARGNVLRLAAAQALTGANSAVIFATGSIVGATLAPDISLATVPISMYVLGLAAGTLPTGAISRAYGRRTAFIIGTCGCWPPAAVAILRGSGCFRRPVSRTWRGVATSLAAATAPA
jgi:MFS family permease